MFCANPSYANKELYFKVYIALSTSFCIYKGLLKYIGVLNFLLFPLTCGSFLHIFPVLFGSSKHIFFLFQMPDMLLFLAVHLVL